jgi:hypothetical protein
MYLLACRNPFSQRLMLKAQKLLQHILKICKYLLRWTKLFGM